MENKPFCKGCRFLVDNYPSEDMCRKWDNTGFYKVTDPNTGKERLESNGDGLSVVFRPRISIMRGTGASFYSPRGFELKLCGPDAQWWEPNRWERFLMWLDKKMNPDDGPHAS
jgi:hypothetical protein